MNNTIKYNEEKVMKSAISDFAKEKIFEIYTKLNESVYSFFITSDMNDYLSFLIEFKTYSIVMPEDIYYAFDAFLSNEISPTLDELSTYYNSFPEEDSVLTNEKMLNMHAQDHLDLIEEIYEFGAEYLQPILI